MLAAANLDRYKKHLENLSERRKSAAAADGYLINYADIEKAVNYRKDSDVMPQVLDHEDEFGIKYYKNKNDVLQQKFEQELRHTLKLSLAKLVS